MRSLWFVLLLVAAASARAAPWSFQPPIIVGEEGRYFHHLDGASSQHLAIFEDTVALVWEDDRDGAPQVYMALKATGEAGFAREAALGSGQEAYEPAVVSFGEGWLVAWEQDGAIWSSVVDPTGPGEASRLSGQGARQVSLAWGGEGALVAVWARDREGGQTLEVADLVVESGAVSVASLAAVPSPGDHAYQGYPSVLFNRDGDLVLAWEDRRAGHTRLFSAMRGKNGEFTTERQLNEHRSPDPVDGGDVVLLGSGVMRVRLAMDGDGTVHAVWLDKRNPASGYAVWGAASNDGGATFEANVKVQDPLGDAVQQWHPAIAARSQGFVAAWDDARARWLDEAEAGDIQVSWSTESGWSEDLSVPGASGEGYQGSPSIAIDEAGGLHLVFVERDDLSAPTRLKYLFAGSLQ